MSRAKAGFIGTDGYVHAEKHADHPYTATWAYAYCGEIEQRIKVTPVPVFAATAQRPIHPACVTAIEDEHRRKDG